MEADTWIPYQNKKKNKGIKVIRLEEYIGFDRLR